MVGTSLLCSLVAEKFLKEEINSIVFFEASTIGGAWGDAKIDFTGVRAPRFNNIVFPYNSKQEKYLAPLNSFFEKAGADVIQISSGFSTICPYVPSCILTGNFAGAIRHILALPSVDVKKEKVWAIRVEPNCVFINEQPFDLAVLPQNAPIGIIEFLPLARGKGGGTKLRHQSQTWLYNTSEHIRVLFHSDFDVSEPVYSEVSDPIFDRLSFLPGDDHPYFVGRVSRSLKGQNPRDLLWEAPVMNHAINSIKAFDRQLFTQARLDATSVEHLKNLAFDTRLILLDGVDLLSGLEGAVKQIARHF